MNYVLRAGVTEFSQSVLGFLVESFGSDQGKGDAA